ncbi:flagellar assembly protein FliH [Indiicoccus explosivorum]|uniref:flagellar assembly protein FliH n=1 Tax=Indiicoccus explosivorum TaxID=1917864 RepID=UPI0013903A6B|nr:flagellar assembly protein FliH [Indiicoccus explosivorum]
MSKILRPAITRDTKEIEIRTMLIRDFFSPEEQSEAEKQLLDEQRKELDAQQRRLDEGFRQLEDRYHAFRDEMVSARSSWDTEKQQLQQQAYEEGFQQGFEEGRSKGFESVTEAIGQANETVRFAEQQAAAYLEDQERIILELALTSAEQIMNTEIAEAEEKYIPLVKKAIKAAREADKVKVFIPPARYRLLTENREELVSLLPADIPLIIFAEDGLEETAGFIETNFGRIDFSIDEQLSGLRTKLTDMLTGGTG